MASLCQLKEGAAIKNPDIWQAQGVIQCFEYTFELAWKTLQDFLEQKKGYDAKGPRPVIEQSFSDGIIIDGETWMDMLKSHNKTAHLYDEKEVHDIYKKIVNDYLAPFGQLQAYFEQNL